MSQSGIDMTTMLESHASDESHQSINFDMNRSMSSTQQIVAIPEDEIKDDEYEDFTPLPSTTTRRDMKRETVLRTGSFREVDRGLRCIRVSYYNELSEEYEASIKKYNDSHRNDKKAKDVREAPIQTMISMDAEFIDDAEFTTPKKKTAPNATVWVAVSWAYFFVQMSCMYMWLIPGRVLGVVVIALLHCAITAFVSYHLHHNWGRKFVVTHERHGRWALGIFGCSCVLYMLVPLWLYLISNAVQTAKFLWLSMFAILLSDFLFVVMIVGLWVLLKGPIHIAGLTTVLVYMYIMMNVLGMGIGGYIGGVMVPAPANKQDWLTFFAKGSARVVYVNFFLQAACIFRSFTDPLFASAWWLSISRNHTSTYVPFSAIHLHMIFNAVSGVAWILHTIMHVFRYENFSFWTHVWLGCVGARPPPQVGTISYATYYCPDAYYYLITGIFLCFLFGMQSVFSAFRRQSCCMYYLRVWHKPISYLIYVMFALHARAAFVLVFVLFQLMDELINGWKLLTIREIVPYFHKVDRNGIKLEVATVMKVVLDYRVHCAPANYAFIRLKYPNAPFEAIPFTMVGGANDDYVSFNIEMNLGRARVATTWFEDICGIGARKIQLDLKKDVRVAMFGPFSSTAKPITAFGNVIVVTQGIGITPGAAVLKSVLRQVVKSGVRSFASVTVFWSNSRDKREYEDEMVVYDDENEIESIFDEKCLGNVKHSRIERNGLTSSVTTSVRELSGEMPAFGPALGPSRSSDGQKKRRLKRTMSGDMYVYPKRDGPLVDCESPVWINLIISGGGRGRFSPGFFHKEFSRLRSAFEGDFGVFCCGKAMWKQMQKIQDSFRAEGFEFHNESF